jgi:tetratricopeptide (TPR) repeat protein
MRGARSAASLERAIALYVDWQERGGDDAERTALLAAHAELRDHLDALFGDRAGAPLDDAGPGTRIGGYRILRELGRGGMGVVYEAYDGSLDRRVALKVLTAHLTLQPSSVARFKREALAAARLDHPGIVKVLAVGSDGDTHWFAMERIDGPNLAEAAPRPVRETVAIGAALADALRHAHEHGVLHRDVKPSNVLLRADGQPVLTDFGLARDDGMPSLTLSGGFLGTPYYVSPEQAQGGDVDARSDVFSLGATLYELCTGRLPFDAPDGQQVLQRILRDEPRDPCGGPRAVDRDLGAILLRALEKPPARRYPNAAAFGRDLLAWLAGEPVTARLPSATERLWRWTRRSPARAGLAVALALGLPAIAGLAGYQVANAPVLEAGRVETRRRALESAVAAGFDAHADEHGTAARAAFQAALDVEPACAEAHLGIALSLAAEGRFEQAYAGLPADPPGSDAFQRVRAGLLRGLDRAAEAEAVTRALPEPQGALAHFATATLAFDRAKLNNHRDLFRVALRHFTQAVIAAPAPRLHFHLQLAMCAENAGDEAAETQALAAIEELWPDDPLARRKVASRRADHDPERAVPALREALANARPEQRVKIAHDVAYAYQRARRFEAAAAAYRATIAIDPRYSPAHNNLGMVLDALGRHREAVAAWRTGLEHDPRYHKFHLNIGKVLRQLGNEEQALAAYRAALAIRPDYAIAWYNLGNTLAAAKQQDAAVEAFRKATAAEPTYGRAFANLGELLIWQGSPEAAVPELRAAVRLLPRDVIPRLNLARALACTGDHAGARAALEECLAVAPSAPTAWIAYAECLVDDAAPAAVRDPALAVVAARKAVALAKDPAAALVTLAAAQLEIGDAAGARQTLEHAAGEPGANGVRGLPERIERLRARLAQAPAAASRPARR